MRHLCMCNWLCVCVRVRVWITNLSLKPYNDSSQIAKV